VNILLKRAYEQPSADDGKRILVERLWPRGIKKEKAKIDAWPKEVAPSTQLRKWYSHDPAKWEEFKRRYWKELEEQEAAVSKIAEEAKAGKMTFVFASKEAERNNAVALKEYIEHKFGR
jgi:uncharacterized protein YeaO (DUF488 family)